ncbi:hypothetical protein PSACC_00410 [Paramicrosporidium saccamoebae]|uniref:Protein PNS1 n=1 Tax=Paramicrosporidium saccamoebae TaxID=1246581 RepID=A0A2H9TPS4_9FUNG|nr:hypothetical protein PSACC_00410 [Paramicrosporidium saccamoebae]
MSGEPPCSYPEEEFDEPCDTVGQVMSASFWIHLSMSMILAISCIAVGFLEHMGLGGTAKRAIMMSSYEIVISTGFVVVAMIIARKAPVAFQHMAAGGTILLLLLYALFIATYNYLISILMVLVSLFLGWRYWRGRASYQFSGQLLRATCICADANPGLYYIPPIGALLIYFYVQLAILAWAGFLAALPDSLQAYSYYIAIYLFMNIFWTCQVILGTLRSITARVYANFFTTTGAPPSGLMRSVVKDTLSHGMDNICVGSAAVLLISAVYSVLRWSLGLFIISLSSTQPRAFNYFAFNHITDRRPFMQSSRETWDTVQSTGVMAVYSANTVSYSLSQATSMIALLSAFLTIFSRILIFGADERQSVLMFLELCVFGAVIPTLFFMILDHGHLSMLIALAEQPEKVKKRAPRLFETLERTFPQLSEVENC